MPSARTEVARTVRSFDGVAPSTTFTLAPKKACTAGVTVAVGLVALAVSAPKEPTMMLELAVLVSVAKTLREPGRWTVLPMTAPSPSAAARFSNPPRCRRR